MKKRKQSTKDNKPVTLKQLNQALKPILGKFKGMDNKFEAIDGRFKQINKRFEAIDGRFKQIDKRFEAIDKRFEAIDRRFDAIDKRFILQDARIEALEKAVHNLEETVKDSFTKMYNHIDAFMKRAESNEHEILFLGRQHDDLAKYCTEKIGYPTYGRN